jgi:hypothetical protein
MRKLTTPLRALAALTLAAFTLTGCMKVDMNLTINSNDTVSGTAIIAMDKRLIGLTGKTEEEVVAEMTKESDLPKSAKQEKYAEGDYVGAKIVFTDTKLAEFTGDSADDFKIVHKDGKYTFDAAMDLSSIKLDDPAVAAFANSFTVKIAITFPGKVLEQTGGTVSGNTVTWTPKAGVNTKLHAVSEEGSSFPIMLVAVLGGVVLLLIIVVIVVVVIASSRKKGAAQAQAGIEPLPADADEAAVGETATDETAVEETPAEEATVVEAPADAPAAPAAPENGETAS